VICLFHASDFGEIIYFSGIESNFIDILILFNDHWDFFTDDPIPEVQILCYICRLC